MNKFNFPKVLGYLVSIIAIITGIIILTNILNLQVIPFVRYVFGIVCILMGIYRYVITRTRYRDDIIITTKKIFKNNHILFLICYIIIFGCTKTEKETATSGQLSICVSESHLSIVRKHIDEFNSLYSRANVSGFGAPTREAIVNFINDSVKLIIIDRPFNKEEQSISAQANFRYQQLKIGEDALVIIVNKLNKLKSIPIQYIEDIITRKISNWNQLTESNLSGPIEFILTGKNSGAYELLKNYFFKIEKEIIPTVSFESQNKVLDYVSTHTRAIGIVSVAYFRTVIGETSSKELDTSELVHSLAIVTTDSTGNQVVNRLYQANIYQGLYPLHYPFYIYFNERSMLAAGFCSYIASAPGQKIILKSGLVPATMPVRLVQLKQE